MLNVLNLALPFFLLIFLGYGSGKWAGLPKEGLAWMNFFVLYLALPALFFQLLSQTPLEELAALEFIAATTLATFSAFLLAFLFARFLKSDCIGSSAIQGLVGSYSNIGYMGPGVTLAVLGAGATVPTALILCFDTVLLFILIPLLMSFAGDESRTGWMLTKQISQKILTHPFILAVSAGILAAALDFEPPVVVDRLLTYLRSAAAPCALFAMGVTIALQPANKRPKELPILLGIKLLIHPLLALFLMRSFGVSDDLWIFTGILMASLPPAANVYVLAQQYHTYVERASTSVLFGTIASVITVPLFIYLIQNSELF